MPSGQHTAQVKPVCQIYNSFELLYSHAITNRCRPKKAFIPTIDCFRLHIFEQLFSVEAIYFMLEAWLC